MGELSIEAETGAASLDEVRADIDAALEKHLPGDLLTCRWNGDVLHISGPGARGMMVFDAGRLKVRGSLRPPAGLLQPVIEHKIKAAFAEAFPNAGSTP